MNGNVETAIIGHDVMNLSCGLNEKETGSVRLKAALLDVIKSFLQSGNKKFRVLLDWGVGLWAAEMLMDIKTEYPDIELTCVQTWEEQSINWPEYLRERYLTVLSRCDGTELASKNKGNATTAKAIDYTISPASKVIAVYSPLIFNDKDLDVALQNASIIKEQIIVVDPILFKTKFYSYEHVEEERCKGLSHLSETKIAELMRRYYDMENYEALVEEYSLTVGEDVIYKFFPPEDISKNCSVFFVCSCNNASTPYVRHWYSRTETAHIMEMDLYCPKCGRKLLG